MPRSETEELKSIVPVYTVPVAVLIVFVIAAEFFIAVGRVTVKLEAGKLLMLVCKKHYLHLS